MKAAIYLGREDVEARELPDSVCDDNNVVIKKSIPVFVAQM